MPGKWAKGSEPELEPICSEKFPAGARHLTARRFSGHPDLLWEIRTGRRVAADFQRAPKSPIYVGATFLMWATLPLVWYSLCKVP
jgi:hypothetical protein